MTRLTGAVMVAAAAVLLLPVGCGGGGVGEGEEAVTNVAVHTGTVTRTTLHRWVAAYGRVAPEPGGGDRAPARALVGAAVSGVLRHIDCSEGQQMVAGATLFRLDDRVAGVALERAQQALEYADKTYRRQQELTKADGTSARALQEAAQQRDAASNELAAARTQLDLLRITSPIAATVTRIEATLGQTIEPGMVLAELIDLDRLVVSAELPSRDAATVHPGQPVELSPGGSPAGRIVYVGATIDRTTDTVPIRTSVPRGAGLAPGQFVHIRILVEEHAGCLAVPEASLVTGPTGDSWVMTVEGDRAVRRAVTAGLREDGLVEIAGEGVREGMPIVTDDAYALPRETAIRILEP
jgi:membrane fusion protein (multidrug efflux system)